MKGYITAPINYLFYFHILCCKMKCIYTSLGRNIFPRFNTLLKSDSENLSTSQDTAMLAALHCIKAVLLCPSPTPRYRSRVVLLLQAAKLQLEWEREGVGRAENERRCYSPKKIFFSPEILSLSLFRFQTEPQYK